MKVVTVEVVALVEDEVADKMADVVAYGIAQQDSMDDLPEIEWWEVNIIAERDATPEDE